MITAFIAHCRAILRKRQGTNYLAKLQDLMSERGATPELSAEYRRVYESMQPTPATDAKLCEELLAQGFTQDQLMRMCANDINPANLVKWDMTEQRFKNQVWAAYKTLRDGN